MARVSDVNTTDIRDAIRLGCRTMSNVFNADDNDIPFFGVLVRPEAAMTAGMADHVPGRHLNGLLNAEDAAGITLDEEVIDKHARAAFFSYTGPVPLPMKRSETGGPMVAFGPHSIREGFHALCALAKYRDSAQARSTAEASISAIFEYWDPDGGWDGERLEREHGIMRPDAKEFISGIARSIGPLVKYYRATGHGPALELAIVLKEKAIGQYYTEEGGYHRELFGTHGHSVTCVMSSLAQLADLTSDSVLMGRVKAFYDNGLWDMRDELGWSIEYTGPDADPDGGELNNTGDILETALILGRWGHTDYYHDAERILRGYFLPSQLRDVA